MAPGIEWPLLEATRCDGGGCDKERKNGLGHYLTSFISHYEDGGGRSQSLGIKHLYRDQVLRVRIQVVDLVALRENKQERRELEDEFDKAQPERNRGN